MKVYAYIRVSTDMQGNSMQMQLDKINTFVGYKNFSLAGIYSDEDVSAGKAFRNRPQGGELIKLLSTVDEPVGIVITNLTRAFRNLVDAIGTAEWCRKKKVSIFLIEDGIEVDTSTPNGFLQFGLQALIAQWERMTISKRTSDIQQNKKARNEVYCAGKFGYKTQGRIVDADNKVLSPGVYVPDEEEMAVVEKMKNYHSRGWSLSMIAKHLTEHSVKTKRGGTKWSHSQVKSILKTHNYL
jgi:DNA invertase Pin-like site-specific DNA recombinase